MKIGLDISQIVYQTGVSRYTEQLLIHLLELDGDNHYFVFGGSLRQKNTLKAFVSSLKYRPARAKITSLSPHLIDFFWNRLGLFSPDIWFKDLDVFHASNWAIPSTRAKLITTIHDLTFLKQPQSHTPYSIKVHTRHLKRARQKASLVLTDSESTRKDLIDWGLPAAKIRVIHLAPAPVFKPVNRPKKIKAVKAKYGLESKYIISVGTQEPRKNLRRLIKAYSQLPRQYSKINLVICGKFGWGEKTTPIPGVKLLGFVPDEDLAGLYSGAQVLAYPSLYEGFGLPVLEAMACSCPVITSNISSLPELGGPAAIYVNPSKTNSITRGLIQVLGLSRGRRLELKQLSLTQARQFSWVKTAQQTLKAYKEVSDADRS